MSRRRAMLLIWGACLAGALVPVSARAADEAVPAELALRVMLRVLTYDAAFAHHGTGDFIIAIAYPSGSDEARDAALAAAGQLPEKSIQGRALKFVPVEFTSTAPLTELVRKAGGNAVLAPAGLSAGDYAAISASARALKIYGLALVPAGAEAGLVLSVANNNGRPQVLLHRESSQAIGASWPPAVLKLARLL